MKRILSLVTSAMIGAGLMYLVDPEHGARRRAVGRDRATHIVRRRGAAVSGLIRHLMNRARGTLVAAHERSQSHVPDQVLVARIRSKIGHVVAHPHGIEVAASGGHVTLAGHVLTNELTSLLKTVEAVIGVVDVENRLIVQQSADGILALQPRTPGTNYRGAVFAAAVFGGAAEGALLALVPSHSFRS